MLAKLNEYFKSIGQEYVTFTRNNTTFGYTTNGDCSALLHREPFDLIVTYQVLGDENNVKVVVLDRKVDMSHWAARKPVGRISGA